MTPFEQFCKEKAVSIHSEFTLDVDGDSYRVEIHKDDGTILTSFKVLEALSSRADYVVGEYLLGYISDLTPTEVKMDSIEVPSWDFSVAAQLKVKAEIAIQEYNYYIAKRPSIKFSKIG